MRLLNVHTLRLHAFHGDRIPPYTILSHTWLEDHEEVTFTRFQKIHPLWGWRTLAGAGKLDFLCQQTAQDGYDWAWMDTCCIDKTNNVELSEAINSMFCWYQRAQVCYVYLVDVDIREINSDILASRWWSRAWTLQELVAPPDVRFYDTQWRPVGSKTDHAESIAESKLIDVQTLRNADSMHTRSVAQRMSWAAHRQATREEDLAYSLLGLFNINMTMQYGEGERAFLRLQKEITKATDDMSIFAWGLSSQPVDRLYSSSAQAGSETQSKTGSVMYQVGSGGIATHGLYALRPSEFSCSHSVIHLAHYVNGLGVEENHGHQVLDTFMLPFSGFDKAKEDEWVLALLPCVLENDPHSLIGILLRRWHHDRRRTIRYSFMPNIYSCLVPSAQVRAADQRELKVDIEDTNKLFWHSLDDVYSSRSLIVELDNIEAYPFDVVEGTHWQRSDHNHCQFTSSDASRCLTTLLRFHKQGSPLAIFLLFSVYGKERSVTGVPEPGAAGPLILALPASAQHTLESIQTAMQSSHKSESISPRPLCGSPCGHDRLYTTIALKAVFNQIVITLTLGMLVEGTTPPSHEAICMNREEWFAVEASGQIDQPRRKRGLMTWTN